MLRMPWRTGATWMVIEAPWIEMLFALADPLGDDNAARDSRLADPRIRLPVGWRGAAGAEHVYPFMVIE